MKRILMIAFHYPPMVGSSGIQRSLKFSTYLLDYGWEPIVLTAQERAYQKISADQLKEIPKEVTVKRAIALDTARHLAIKGSYLRFLAMPDRWVSWWLGAVVSGLKLIRSLRPQVLWSTYPIATAHLVGLTLHRLTGLPWVADFRDSMTEEKYPRNQYTRRIYRWIEHKTVSKAARVVFTAPGTVKMYADRYPSFPSSHWAVIPNGYDDENFVSARAEAKLTNKQIDRHIKLIHSGLLYPSERDPRVFFRAIKELKDGGQLMPDELRVCFRASGYDQIYEKIIKDYNIERLVSLEPRIGYREALIEMFNSDGLLLFQASNCNHQVPAKLYEYLRAQKPILALTDPKGDTAGLLQQFGVHTIVPLDSKDKIKKALINFLDLLRKGQAPIVNEAKISSYSRRSLTGELANLLDTLI